MKNHVIALFILLMNVCSPLYSQSGVSYGYDAAGNRVSRVIVLDPARSAPAPQEDQAPVVYSEMLSDIELKIYPNPTDGLLKVEIRNLPDKQTAGIMVYSLSGQPIVSLRKTDGLTEVDISSQPAGIYLMKIVAGEYQTEWRIIKK